MPIHNVYARLPEAIRSEVDAAYTHARKVLASAGLNPANDDRAERLVEAIAVYVLESEPDIASELDGSTSLRIQEEWRHAVTAIESRPFRIR